jgi:WD40 repeat protein
MLLAELTQLQTVFVAGTNVTDAGVARLQAERGTLKIDRLSLHRKATALASREIFNHAILHLALAPGGRELVAGSGDGRLLVWDLASRAMVRSVQAHDDWTFTAEFHPSGKWLATGGGDDLVKFWSWPELVEIGRLTGHDDDVHAIGFTPDGTRLVSAGDDWSVRIWDVASRRELFSLSGHEGSIPGLAIGPSGELAATASRDGTVRLWSIAAGREAAVLSGHTADVMSVAFSPDGGELASASYDGTVRVWGKDSGFGVQGSGRTEGERVAHTSLAALRVSSDWLFAVAWSPSGEELIAAAGDGVRRLDRASGRELWKSTDQTNVSHVLWLDQGSIATSSSDASIALWQADTGRKAATLWTRFVE